MRKFIVILLLIALAIGLVIFASNYSSESELNSVTEENVMENEKSSDFNELDLSLNEIYGITQENSSATFRIDEVLNGSPFTAVGTTSVITGDIAFSTSGELVLGKISIDAGSFKTDNRNRDGAIANSILKAREEGNQFVTFLTTSLVKIDENNYEATGDMTIAGVTKTETLKLNFSKDGTTLTGDMSGSLKRSDYNLEIPNVPFVSDVADVFSIEAEITATRK